MFLVHELPSWRRNRTARVVRRPKLHIADSGLAAGLLGLTTDAVASLHHPMTGPLLETFAVNEIVRLCAASEMPVSLHHYRDSNQHEVDLVIERSDGAVVAVEIKATSSPRADDLRPLARFRDRLDAVDPARCPPECCCTPGPTRCLTATVCCRHRSTRSGSDPPPCGHRGGGDRSARGR